MKKYTYLALISLIFATSCKEKKLKMMNFIASSSYLLKQLQVLGSVINSNNTLPILDNFLFELDNNQLHVSASDLETTMSASLEIESNSKGSVAIPAKLLLDILKTISLKTIPHIFAEELYLVKSSSEIIILFFVK